MTNFKDPHYTSEYIPKEQPYGIRDASLSGADARKYLWAGRISHVDVETWRCSIQYMTGHAEIHDVPLTAPGGAGPRSFSGTIPEIGSIVIFGFKRFSNNTYLPYIIEYLNPGIYLSKDYAPFSTITPDQLEEIKQQDPELLQDPTIIAKTVRIKRRKVYPGDYVASSSSGSDFILDRDVYLTNRSGAEFRLRDSDNTIICQALNEFTANSAGYYRRGLIKRNAFNLFPDLFADSEGNLSIDLINSNGEFDLTNAVLPSTSPAFKELTGLDLVDSNDGSIKFIDNAYPYIVTSDGQRISYVTALPAQTDQDFADTLLAYTEDRRELRHVHNGIMDVTEEGDGYQIDNDIIYKPYIEDVIGTVVGNNPYTEKNLYKKILKYRLFQDSTQNTTGQPILEPVSAFDPHEADTVALAKLLRITSPNNNNQFVFGITKDGKVTLHVPASSGEPDEAGRSIDLNTLGRIKAVLGMDQSRTSLDLSTVGGIKLDIGGFGNGFAVDLVLNGAVRQSYRKTTTNGRARETIVSGSDALFANSQLSVVSASSTRSVGAEDLLEATARRRTIGLGGNKEFCAGDDFKSIAGKHFANFAQLSLINFALGQNKLVVAGVDSTVVTAGLWSVTNGAGAVTMTAAAGNMSFNVGAGTMLLNNAAGAITISTAAGAVSVGTLAGAATMSATALVAINGATATINSGLVTIGGPIPVLSVLRGIPGPPGVPTFDYITGAPLIGSPTVYSTT